MLGELVAQKKVKGTERVDRGEGDAGQGSRTGQRIRSKQITSRTFHWDLSLGRSQPQQIEETWKIWLTVHFSKHAVLAIPQWVGAVSFYQPWKRCFETLF